MVNDYVFKKTHHGRFLGVPVWLDMTNPECPAIEAKFGVVGDACMNVMEFLFGCFTWLQTAVNPYYEPLFPILVGDEVSDEN